MKFYIFNNNFELIDRLEDAGFVGNLFVYNTHNADYFTKIARDLDVHKKIMYMVAIRPYVISPEYLVMVHKSIRDIARGSRLQLNLISGHIKPNEDVVRTLGDVNSKSTSVERSEYLVEYIDMMNTLPKEDKPDYYVSVTNTFTFEAAARHGDKMIIRYSQYLDGRYELSNQKVMVSCTAVIRETQEELDKLNMNGIPHRADLDKFTHEDMNNVLARLQKDGINEIIFSSWNEKDLEEIINFVKNYNKK